MSKAWPKLRLGEVLTERREVPDTEALELGNTRIVSKIGFDQGKIELRNEAGTKTGMILVRPGDLLLSGINAAKGAIAVYGQENGEPVAATIHYGAYEVRKDRANLTYLWWYLRSAAFREILFEALPNGIKTELKSSRFLPIEIPLPPLAEQRRIVARIEELAAKIAEARSLRQQAAEEAEALGASWLNSAFSELTTESVRQLGDVAEIVGGGSLPDTTFAEVGLAEVLLVKVSDMNRPGNEVFMRESALGVRANSPLLKGFRILPPNAIVFPKRGGAIATNKKRLLERPAVLDPNMMGVLSKDERELAPEFLFKWFGNLDLASMQEGTSVPQINKGDLVPLSIPVPPLPEQRRVVAELDALQEKVEALKRLQAETAAELAALLPAVLDRAFKGGL